MDNSPSKPSHSIKNNLRIADILSIPDDTEPFEMDRKPDKCSSPRRFVSRFLCRFKDKRKPELSQSDTAPIPRRSVSQLSGNCNSSSSSDSEQCRKKTTFNQAIGYGFLYLIAASKNELNKMTELRKQMEMFLDNAKEKLKRDDISPKPSESSIISSSFSIDDQESQGSCSHHQLPTNAASRALPEPVTYTSSDYSSKSRRDDSVGGIDQLVAEIENELELLQQQLDAERSLTYPERQILKETIEDNAAASHFSSSEVIDPQEEAGSEVNCGFHPYELERRLHEVLEARQQENIEELESALECAIRELHEKDLEVSWWKDTARLVARHVPKTSPPAHRLGPGTYYSQR